MRAMDWDWIRALALAASLAYGCGGPETPGQGGRDNGREPAARGILAGPILVSIGGDDAVPGPDLYRVNGGFRTNSGHTVLADASTNEIRVLDRAARLVKRFGGTGGGPEEFSALLGIWPGGADTIVAYDLLAQRITYWTLDAGLVKESRITFAGLPGLVARMADGTFVGYINDEVTMLRPGQSRTDSGTVIRASVNLDSVWPIARYPKGTTHTIENPLLEGRPTLFGLPLAPQGLVAAGGQSIWVAYGDGRSIRRFGLSGVGEDSVALDITALELSAAARAEWIDQRVALAPQSDRSRVRRFLEAIPYPDRFPAIDTAMVDALEHLWVRHFRLPRADSAVWSVYAPDGTVVGRTVLPGDLRLLQVGRDYLLAVRRNETDTEVVVVLALTRAPG